jgi:hypothetical protein
MTEEMFKKRLKIKRNKPIEVAFSDDELVDLDNRRGEVPRARFLRETALSQKPARLTTYKKIDPNFLYALNKIGGNLNQIAHFINRQDDDAHIVEKFAVLQNLDLIIHELKELKNNAG